MSLVVSHPEIHTLARHTGPRLEILQLGSPTRLLLKTLRLQVVFSQTVVRPVVDRAVVAAAAQTVACRSGKSEARICGRRVSLLS